MNKASRKAIRTRNSIVFHVFSIMLGFLMIYPLLWLIASSFKSNDTMFLNSYSLIPQEFSIAENHRYDNMRILFAPCCLCILKNSI